MTSRDEVAVTDAVSNESSSMFSRPLQQTRQLLPLNNIYTAARLALFDSNAYAQAKHFQVKMASDLYK